MVIGPRFYNRWGEGEGDGAELVRILSLVTYLITDLSRKMNGLVHMPEILR